MKKKLMSAFLALVLLLTLLPVTASAAEYKGSCGENLKWHLDTATGILTISGTGEMFDYEYNGAPWRPYKDQIRSAVLENGVTSVGEYAFYECWNLASVTIPKGVTRIGAHAFYNCTHLQTATFPDTLTKIEEYAFFRSALQSISIPGSVETIGACAFYECSQLASLTIGDGVKEIGGSAFEECKVLPSVRIPESVTTIGDEAFRNCANLTSVQMADGVTAIGKRIFESDTSLTDVKLSNKLTDLPYGAFWYCRSLARISGLESVKHIGEYAFHSCESLSALMLPEGLAQIDRTAFAGSALTQLRIPSTVIYIGTDAFRSCSNLERIAILNANCDFSSTDTLGVTGVTTIYGYNDSTAQSYALKYGYAFEEITDSNLWEDKNNEPVFNEDPGVENPDIDPPDTKNPFTDVAEGRFYYAPVLWAVDKGITSGMDATHFMPERSCTRGQVVTFLWRAMGCPEPKSGSCPFVDVVAGRFYYKAVLWAAEQGITAGVDATHFKPDATVTRGQFVTFLWRTEGKPAATGGNPFVDVSRGRFYYDAVLWAAQNGITAGMDATHFAPDKACTRGQVVTFLYRDLEK